MKNPSEETSIIRVFCSFIRRGALSCVVVRFVANIALAAGLSDLSSFQATGYLPYYNGSAISQINYSYLTDVVYFSISPTDSGGIESSWVNSADLTNLTQLARRNGVDVHIAVGGNEGDGSAGGFPVVAGSSALRAIFANNLRVFVQNNGLAGANLNWELPSNSSQIQDYSDLINDIKTEFAPHGLELTVALPGWAAHINPSAHASLDDLYIQSYDGGTPHALFSYLVTHVNFWRSQGLPDQKLVAGMPFYGRNSASHALTYQQIMATFAPAPDEDEAGGYHFNGMETIMQKSRYAAEQGLSGIMFWELGQDTTDQTSLLRAAYAGVMLGERIADLNLNGQINGEDWSMFVAGMGQDLSGLTTLERFQMGDMNDDGFNNFSDFVIFKNSYENFYGIGSFETLLAAVPEPATSALAFFACLNLCALWRRR